VVYTSPSRTRLITLKSSITDRDATTSFDAAKNL